MPKTDVAYQLLKFLYEEYKDKIILKYKLTEEEQNSIITQDGKNDIISLMDIIARKRGAIVSGAEVDYEKVSSLILNDFRTGKIGKITLEQINGNK